MLKKLNEHDLLFSNSVVSWSFLLVFSWTILKLMIESWLFSNQIDSQVLEKTVLGSLISFPNSKSVFRTQQFLKTWENTESNGAFFVAQSFHEKVAVSAFNRLSEELDHPIENWLNFVQNTKFRQKFNKTHFYEVSVSKTVNKTTFLLKV